MLYILFTRDLYTIYIYMGIYARGQLRRVESKTVLSIYVFTLVCDG